MNSTLANVAEVLRRSSGDHQATEAALVPAVRALTEIQTAVDIFAGWSTLR